MNISEHKMLSFSIRKKVIENDNSFMVISLSKVGENSDFIANSQSNWLSATGGRRRPPKPLLPSLKFWEKTIEKTIGTIAYCFKNSGLLSFAPLNFFYQEQIDERV